MAASEEEIATSTAAALQLDFHSVVILLDNADDAQIIFESLNYRGQPLLAADLIRNYAFMRAEQNHENVEQIYSSEWSIFEDRFWVEDDRQGRIKKPRLEFFFVNFLASHMANEINQNRVYQEYLEWITPKKQDLKVKQELALIAKNARVYETLVNPKGDSQLAAFGRFCAAFDITIAFPLIMAIFNEEGLDQDTKAEMLHDFESYMVRRSICGRTIKGYNKLFLQAIKDMRTRGFTPFTLRHFLANQKGESGDWPEDAEFQSYFHKRSIYREMPASRLVYILRNLEGAERSKFSEDISINSDLSIEHVLPQSWLETWPLKNGLYANQEQLDWTKRQVQLGLPLDALSKEIALRESVVDTMGNLTLIIGRLNSSVSNNPFKEKREAILRHSSLRLNRYFYGCDEWNEAAIAARSESLFESARTLWPRPANLAAQRGAELG